MSGFCSEDLIICGLQNPCKTSFSATWLVNPELINKTKLINTGLSIFWSEICLTEMFENIHG